MTTLLQHYVLFDSDGNPIAAYPVGDDDTAVNLGCAIIEHWNLVDRVCAEGEDASDPHLTLTREMLGPDSQWYGGPIHD